MERQILAALFKVQQVLVALLVLQVQQVLVVQLLQQQIQQAAQAETAVLVAAVAAVQHHLLHQVLAAQVESAQFYFITRRQNEHSDN
jgi:hypothetical protein